MSTTISSAINAALHELFNQDERVHLLGEDILDPYGGAFKISKGLSTGFPERVHATPIAEGAIVGISNGMALRGLRPIAEIMFGDFITLGFDQIVNHAAKFRGMYNGKATCPVTIRTPMGGGRGYGPTHSQSLEKFLIGIPGIRVVSPNPFHDVSRLYHEAVLGGDDPTIIIEHKLLYGQGVVDPGVDRFGEFFIRRGEGPFPTIHLSLNNFRRADVTLITYGGTTRLAMDAARHALIEHEITADILLMGSLSPLPIDDIVDVVTNSRRAVTIEEGTGTLGLGAEVASNLQERLFGKLTAPVLRVAARDEIIPAARPMEEEMLPNLERVEEAMRKVVGCEAAGLLGGWAMRKEEG